MSPSRHTPATRFLDEQGIVYTRHFYDYEARGGARHAAECLGVPEPEVVKTLVMQTESEEALVVLMHGDRQVSTSRLARAAGARRVSSCSPEAALAATGYQVGGISPFGTRRALRTFVEASVLELERIYINGGVRGMLLELRPNDLERALPHERVRVAR